MTFDVETTSGPYNAENFLVLRIMFDWFDWKLQSNSRIVLLQIYQPVFLKIAHNK